MELSIADQFNEYINRSSRIIIALPSTLYADVVAGAAALRLFLHKLDKETVVVTSGLVPPEFSFLPGVETVRRDLNSRQNLVLMLQTREHKLAELSYEERGEAVHIFLTAKEGSFSPADVSFDQTFGQYDLVVILGAQGLESLGALFSDHADLFYDLPKINIDMHPSNEYFGTINMVDVTASSLAEVIFDILEKTELTDIDPEIATCLLAGIMANTHSFQDIQTTPKAFMRSATLIEMGARQQDVVKYLFKTKQLPLLKLWGRALARFKQNDVYGYMYSVLNSSDFQKTGSNTELITQVLQEFIDNVAGSKVAALLAETSSSAARLLVSLHPQLSLNVFYAALEVKPVSPQRVSGTSRFIDLEIPLPLAVAEDRLVSALEQSLPRQPEA